MSALVVAAAGCGADSSTSGCSPAFQEQLDPASGLHVIDGTEVDYQTDPPTSGPHSVSAIPTGALSAPIARLTQVAILEAGHVLVQYNDTVSDDELVAIGALDELTIVSAPNPGLDEPVVVTAWTWKMECSKADADAIAAIEAFNADHALSSAVGP